MALVEQPFTLLRAPEPRRRYLREARLGFRQMIVEADRQTSTLCRLRLVMPEGYTAAKATHRALEPQSQ